MPPSSVVSQFKSVSSVDDIAQLQRLESLFKLIKPVDVNAEVYGALLRLFERFPDDDAYEMFGSFVHLLEKCRQFDPLLLKSVSKSPVRKSPAMYNPYMIGRLLNVRYRKIGDQDLYAILQECLDTPALTASNQELVEELMRQHCVPNADTNAGLAFYDLHYGKSQKA